MIQRVTTAIDDHGTTTVTGWRTLDTLPAELIPQRATEALRAQQVQSIVAYRFRVSVRQDVTAGMRAKWRPSWSALTTPKALEIIGIVPIGDGRQWMAIECSEVAAA